jgi:hypothetical protein
VGQVEPVERIAHGVVDGVRLPPFPVSTVESVPVDAACASEEEGLLAAEDRPVVVVNRDG